MFFVEWKQRQWQHMCRTTSGVLVLSNAVKSGNKSDFRMNITKVEDISARINVI